MPLFKDYRYIVVYYWSLGIIFHTDLSNGTFSIDFTCSWYTFVAGRLGDSLILLTIIFEALSFDVSKYFEPEIRTIEEERPEPQEQYLDNVVWLRSTCLTNSNY